jgi:aromatic-L-amino-acid decarboxylase
MIWQTSPAAAELEEMIMNWLRQMIGLSDNFTGVIQDTASTATLCSILTAREKFSNCEINNDGFSDKYKFRVYCSTETHSSIEKAVKIAGIGKNNLVKIPVNKNFEMDVEFLEKAIRIDIEKNYKPLCVIATLGTTGSAAIDPLEDIGLIAFKYGLWYHIDAAFAGTALLLPEYKHIVKGIEYADTFVFNPHKWMFTNFDCSAYFLKDKYALLKTFEIMPEYLKTDVDRLVNNYRDWGIQLGRRFRALKLWFVIRAFGVDGLQAKLREHIRLAKLAKELIEDNSEFEIMSKVNFNVICFRFNPGSLVSAMNLNSINKQLLENLNNTGKVYFTHTKLNEDYVIRWVIGQTNVNEEHIRATWNLILKEAKKINLNLQKY